MPRSAVGMAALPFTVGNLALSQDKRFRKSAGAAGLNEGRNCVDGHGLTRTCKDSNGRGE